MHFFRIRFSAYGMHAKHLKIPAVSHPFEISNNQFQQDQDKQSEIHVIAYNTYPSLNVNN